MAKKLDNLKYKAESSSGSALWGKHVRNGHSQNVISFWLQAQPPNRHVTNFFQSYCICNAKLHQQGTNQFQLSKFSMPDYILTACSTNWKAFSKMCHVQ